MQSSNDRQRDASEIPRKESATILKLYTCTHDRNPFRSARNVEELVA